VETFKPGDLHGSPPLTGAHDNAFTAHRRLRSSTARERLRRHNLDRRLTPLRFKRVDQGHTRPFEMTDVAADDGETVFDRRRGDQ
jgi:hypothetical protein